jgi:hypothetical protein
LRLLIRFFALCKLGQCLKMHQGTSSECSAFSEVKQALKSAKRTANRTQKSDV